MYTVSEKLYIIRMLLSLNQKEMAEEAGINQSAVRLLERGEKKCIPPEYLQFFYDKGIDLNWLFNDSSDIEQVFHKDDYHTSSQQENALCVNLSNEDLQSQLQHKINNIQPGQNSVLYKCVFDFENDLKMISEQIKKLNLKLSSFNF